MPKKSNNRLQCLLLILFIVLALSACAKNDNEVKVTSIPQSEVSSEPNIASESANSSSVSESSTSSAAASSRIPHLTVDINKEPLGFEKNAAPDFLNEEQQVVYKKAIELQSPLLIESTNISRFPYLDSQTKEEISTAEIMIDEKQYYMVQGRYSKWDDLYAVMRTIFTEEYFAERFGERFISDENGNALVMSGSRGTNNERTDKADSYELVKQTEKEIEFNVIGYYKSKSDGREYTESFTNKMVADEEGWRISQFEITL